MIMGEMVEWCALASRNHFRIKQWKLSESEAWDLAEEAGSVLLKEPTELYYQMVHFPTQIFDARIVVQ